MDWYRISGTWSGFHSHNLMKSNRQSRVYEVIKEQSTLNQTNTGLRAWQSPLCISHNMVSLEMLYSYGLYGTILKKAVILQVQPFNWLFSSTSR